MIECLGGEGVFAEVLREKCVCWLNKRVINLKMLFLVESTFRILTPFQIFQFFFPTCIRILLSDTSNKSIRPG